MVAVGCYAAGRDDGQMWYPRKLVMLKQSGRYAVCDRGNERSRMQIFARNGLFVRKVAIRFIEILAGLAVTNEGILLCSTPLVIFCIICAL